MDKAIEEAATKIEDMLLQSRVSDSGMKLEVNEKILNSCTISVLSIRVLVQKSGLVRAGSNCGCGEEYSDSQSVAHGANVLLTEANKTVSGEVKHQLNLIVTAQEIAASTTQFVVANRVKAPQGSSNFAALGTASKGVTQSTVAVVATAKDCTKRMEDSLDLDLEKLTAHQVKLMKMEL
uniref:Uncharacterized protein n=1 Tax=Phlebotomus papatasi TaxID=29031 RepID=A0A1B0GND2_PHLPP